MKNYLFVLLGILALKTVQAQDKLPVYNNDEHTLVDDFIFHSLHDLYGYTFAPEQGKLDFAHYPDPVPAGWVRFTINKHEVTILERTEYRPGGIQVLPNREKEYKLRIKSVDDQGIGYKFKVVDIKEPSIVGWVSVRKDGFGRIISLKYMPGPGDHERLYILKYATEAQLEADRAYFTHEEDFRTKTDTIFWGKTLYPFIAYDNYYDPYTKRVKRLKPDDGYNINFFKKKVIVKNNKEKEFKYISFVENSEKKKQVVFKSSEEVLIEHPNGNRKALRLECYDELTKQIYYVIMHRGAQTDLKSIEVQEQIGSGRKAKIKTLFYYSMRRGKGLIPGEPVESPATSTPAEDSKEKVVEAKEEEATGDNEEEKAPEEEDKKGKRNNNK